MEQAGKPERLGPDRRISGELVILEEAITNLEKRFGELHDRLEMMRAPEPITEGRREDGNKEPAAMSPLAERIKSQRIRIDNLFDRINYELEALEI